VEAHHITAATTHAATYPRKHHKQPPCDHAVGATGGLIVVARFGWNRHARCRWRLDVRARQRRGGRVQRGGLAGRERRVRGVHATNDQLALAVVQAKNHVHLACCRPKPHKNQSTRQPPHTSDKSLLPRGATRALTMKFTQAYNTTKHAGLQNTARTRAMRWTHGAVHVAVAAVGEVRLDVVVELRPTIHHLERCLVVERIISQWILRKRATQRATTYNSNKTTTTMMTTTKTKTTTTAMTTTTTTTTGTKASQAARLSAAPHHPSAQYGVPDSQTKNGSPPHTARPRKTTSWDAPPCCRRCKP
jgi:hypothetical protein